MTSKIRYFLVAFGLLGLLLARPGAAQQRSEQDLWLDNAAKAIVAASTLGDADREEELQATRGELDSFLDRMENYYLFDADPPGMRSKLSDIVASLDTPEPASGPAETLQEVLRQYVDSLGHGAKVSVMRRYIAPERLCRARDIGINVFHPGDQGEALWANQPDHPTLRIGSVDSVDNDSPCPDEYEAKDFIVSIGGRAVSRQMAMEIFVEAELDLRREAQRRAFESSMNNINYSIKVLRGVVPKGMAAVMAKLNIADNRDVAVRLRRNDGEEYTVTFPFRRHGKPLEYEFRDGVLVVGLNYIYEYDQGYSHAAQQVRDIVADLGVQPKAFVIDARDTKNGEFRFIAAMASLFVKKKTRLFRTERPKGKMPSFGSRKHTYKSKEKPLFPTQPVVVIVGAASRTGTMLAFSLKSAGRATIVGELPMESRDYVYTAAGLGKRLAFTYPSEWLSFGRKKQTAKDFPVDVPLTSDPAGQEDLVLERAIELAASMVRR